METFNSEPQSPRSARPMTLPAPYYVDPNHFQQEMERYFLGSWICVGREEQIEKPGSYFLADVMNESLIVTKDENGKPRAFFNLCRHRGTRLCTKSEGTFNGRISCPYHAWTYALDGRLVGFSQMGDKSGFSPENFPLHQARCETWDGHVWISLSSKSTTLKDQLEEVWDKFRNWHCDELKLGKRVKYDIRANWKLIIQNYSECLHCPAIHPTLKRLTHYLSGDNEPVGTGFLGGHMTLNDGVQTMTESGKTTRPILSGLSEEQKRRVFYYWISPNLLLSLHPDYMMTHTLWPKGPDRTEVLCEWHFHPEAMKATDFTPEDAFQFWDSVNREDWHVSELSQLGISSKAYTPGPYSVREELLSRLDNILTGRNS